MAEAGENERAMARYAADWQRNAEVDPLWAVLTARGRAGGRWDEAAFFRTGADEVRRLFDYMAAAGAAPVRRRRFLDFGCGVGRLSRALADRFESGLGIDISARMIELAAAYNADRPGLAFRVNAAPDLRLVADDSIDFVLTHIVLQHMPNALQRTFIAEFLRLLAPGGIAAFQVPTARLAPRGPAALWRRAKAALPPGLKRRLKAFLGRPLPDPRVHIEMHALASEAVEQIVAAAGCELVAAPYTNSTDESLFAGLVFFDEARARARALDRRIRSDHLSRFFFARKPA